MTKQQLKEELKQSMLAKDSEKTSMLRMVLAAIQSFELKKREEAFDKKAKEAEKADTNIQQDEQLRYEASEEDVMAVIQKEVKQHKDSLEQFRSAGRDELVTKEEKEIAFLQVYLPAQMDEEAIRKLVSDAIEKSGAAGPQDIGKVMGVLMPQVKGKADGALVSKVVREALAK
jgi:uncharacterized protein YqeY